MVVTERVAKSWRNAIFAVFLVNGFAVATLLARVPGFRDALDIDPSEVSLFILGFSGGSVIGLLFSSHILHALGGRRTILVMLSAVGVGLVAVGWAASVLQVFIVAIIAAAIFGAGSGINDVAQNVEGALAERALGRTTMPLLHAGFSLGTVAGALIGAAAAAIDFPIWLHCLVGGVITIAVAFIATRYVPAADGGDEEESKPTFRERMGVWLEPRTILIGIMVLCFAYTEGAANDWIALALVDGRGFDNAQGALMLGVFTAAMTVGRLVGGRALDRFGRVPVLVATAILAAIGLSLVIFAPEPWVIVIGAILWGLGASLGFPIGMSAASDEPRRAAARVSAVAMVAYIAFLGGPPLIGFLGEQIGVLQALTVILGLIVIAGVVAPAARPPKGQASSSPTELELREPL